MNYTVNSTELLNPRHVHVYDVHVHKSLKAHALLKMCYGKYTKDL